MRRVTLETKVVGGSVPTETWGYIKKALAQHEGKIATITIDRKKRVRSTPQLRYYHGVCIPLITSFMRGTGLDVDKDDVDAYLRINVLKVRKKIGDTWVPGHTVKLSTAEMEERLESLRQWGAEVGCDIPMPNEGTRYDT